MLCERCVLADTLWRRMRGLIGRRELDAGRRNRPPAVVVGAHVLHALPDRRRLRGRRSGRRRRSFRTSGPGVGDVPRRAGRRRARAPASVSGRGIETGQRLAWAARPGRPPDASDRRRAASDQARRPRATARPECSSAPRTTGSCGWRASCSRATTSGRVDEAARKDGRPRRAPPPERRRHRRDRLARRRRAHRRGGRGAASARRR